MINIDDFKKIELRVAEIISAECVSGSEKLLKLSVDVGEIGQRQIVAGIGAAYTPESLIGRQIIIVANLEPRTLMGLESQGMLLAANSSESGPVILMPERKILPGSTIK